MLKEWSFDFFARSLFFAAMIFVSAFGSVSLRAADSNGLFLDHPERYEMSLKRLCAEMELDLGVTVECPEEFAAVKIPVAPWKLAADPAVRLATLLTPVGLYFEKNGEKSYKVIKPSYYRRSLDEATAHLNRLLARSNTLEKWENRRIELRAMLYEKLDLNPMPQEASGGPVISDARHYEGYSVRNVALPILPGFYVSASVYLPDPAQSGEGAYPLILCPHGHSQDTDENKTGRFLEQMQSRCATFARMGAVCVSYSMFAWENTQLQVESEAHRTEFSGTIQTLTTMRILDYALARSEIDSTRVGITGESGGGTQTFLATAMDDRITVAAPIVMVSATFFGGCPCESGVPIHIESLGTCNAEIAAMAAPRPLLIVSITQDWTSDVPELEFPYLQKIYALYGKGANVENVHIDEPHDYGKSKRAAVYPFMAKHLGLDFSAVDESKVTIEPASALKPFGPHGELLPKDALSGFEALKKVLSVKKKAD